MCNWRQLMCQCSESVRGLARNTSAVDDRRLGVRRQKFVENDGVGGATLKKSGLFCLGGKARFVCKSLVSGKQIQVVGSGGTRSACINVCKYAYISHVQARLIKRLLKLRSRAHQMQKCFLKKL